MISSICSSFGSCPWLSMAPSVIGRSTGRINPATPPNPTLNAPKNPLRIPYAHTSLPAVALFTFLIRSAAASRRPFASSTPVTSRIIIKIAMLRFATKFVPSVSRSPSIPRPPARAVVTAAKKIIRMESSFSANPSTTIRTPISLIYSIDFPPSFF